MGEVCQLHFDSIGSIPGLNYVPCMQQVFNCDDQM